MHDFGHIVTFYSSRPHYYPGVPLPSNARCRIYLCNSTNILPLIEAAYLGPATVTDFVPLVHIVAPRSLFKEASQCF